MLAELPTDEGTGGKLDMSKSACVTPGPLELPGTMPCPGGGPGTAAAAGAAGTTGGAAGAAPSWTGKSASACSSALAAGAGVGVIGPRPSRTCGTSKTLRSHGVPTMRLSNSLSCLRPSSSRLTVLVRIKPASVQQMWSSLATCLPSHNPFTHVLSPLWRLRCPVICRVFVIGIFASTVSNHGTSAPV